MRVSIYQVDAFADAPFGGNPAAVMILPDFPADDLLRAIAAENNLSETAFLVQSEVGWRLRWFTPRLEVPLCGHATLASAWVVLRRLEPAAEQVAFHTASGVLTVRRSGDRFIMDFPARTLTPIEKPAGLEAALGCAVTSVIHDGFNYIAVLEEAAQVRALTPDLATIAAFPVGGVVATAPGDAGYDCVSRYFAPAKGVGEDPVTGAAHCALAPYWSRRLGRDEIRAYQASSRGGELLCRVAGDRVELEGACAFYMEGSVDLPVILNGAAVFEVPPEARIAAGQ